MVDKRCPLGPWYDEADEFGNDLSRSCVEGSCAWWQEDRCGVLQQQARPLIIQFDGSVSAQSVERFAERLRAARVKL